MKIIIAGGSGFIGRDITDRLSKSGYSIYILSRKPKQNEKLSNENVSIVEWDMRNIKKLTEIFSGDYGIINLAGENISTGRWTEVKKARILHSRLHSVRALAEATELSSEAKPKFFIQGSAIGYYDAYGDDISDEDSPKGSGFLSDVVAKMEELTKELLEEKTRLVIIRTGIVLGKDGGALPKLLTPYRFYAGGPIGTGHQWQSWIHINDVAAAVQFLMEKKDQKGIFNLTAPAPVKMKELSAAIASVLNKPSWLPVPGLALKLAFGEMAEAIMLNGERAVPKRLLDAGFTFSFADIKKALINLLN